jgi:large subunit ribosomal protein L5
LSSGETPGIERIKDKMTPRLLERYRNEIVPKLMQDFNIKNKMAVPAVVKVVVNMGVGEGTQDIKVLEKAADELAAITGRNRLCAGQKRRSRTSRLDRARR